MTPKHQEHDPSPLRDDPACLPQFDQPVSASASTIPADDSRHQVGGEDALPTGRGLTQVEVNPSWFVDAARAAFEVGRSYRNPHSAVLGALEKHLSVPTTTGLPDPFAHPVRVLAHALYGVSRAYWDEATSAFRRRYLHRLHLAKKVRSRDAAREARAAMLRWRTLMAWVEESGEALCEWLEDIQGLYPKASAIQPRHRATAMVYQAAITAIWEDDSREPTDDERFVLNTAGLLFMTSVTGRYSASDGVDDHVVDTIWSGLFDHQLMRSRRVLSPLAQRLLGYLVTMVGRKGDAPAETYRVWADDLAAWERWDPQWDPQWVREGFASSDPTLSPAHEIAGFSLELPDCLWSDYPGFQSSELPWFEAPPRSGQLDGQWWQEVTINRQLLPYFRRLSMYLDRLPLGAAG